MLLPALCWPGVYVQNNLAKYLKTAKNYVMFSALFARYYFGFTLVRVKVLHGALECYNQPRNMRELEKV